MTIKMPTGKIDSKRPLVDRLRFSLLPTNLRFASNQYPDSWKLVLPRDSTYRKVQPIDVTFRTSEVALSDSKGESLSIPYAQVKTVQIAANGAELSGGVALVPMSYKYFNAVIIITQTNDVSYFLTLPTFKFVGPFIDFLIAQQVAVSDPLWIADHLTDINDCLKRQIAAKS
ncbi:hypothetical protein [Lacticaseibacillus zhaodongensis]|uniref:hypothetical protein n=1 Tax=Lacticaseibacillus zhaodongensis TaxID=2668065 RepID=UPI0012D2DE20|nr:hypothetical protein [Lacticaseibacillus zhaodongensis]